MIELPRRKFLIGSLVSLFAAPAIVRASSLMPVRAYSPFLSVEGVVNEALASTSSLDYEYWAVGPMGLAKYAAREIVKQPLAYQGWLNDASNPNWLSLRPVREDQKGLQYLGSFAEIGFPQEAQVVRDIGRQLDADPQIAALRKEQLDLARQLRQARSEEQQTLHDALRKAHLA